MSRIWRIFLLGSFSFLPGLFGQAVARGEPAVQFPSGSASWLVTFQQTGEPASARTPKTISVAQGDGMKCYQVEWSDGSKNEVWWTTTIVLEEDPLSGEIHALQAEGDVRPSVGLFEENLFQWVRPDTFVGKQTLDGKSCLLFRAVTDLGADRAMECSAWIDEMTRLPRALEADGRRLDFTFGSSPSAPLRMPERFRKKFAALTARPAEPSAYKGRR